MFQLTVKRAIMNNINHIYVVSNVKHNFMIREQMEELDISYYTIISEPFGKDTCTAITSATLISNVSNILVMSSDHVWEDNVFSDVVMKAVNINTSVTVFGIVPTYPEIGYGYIEYDDNKLIKFVEKPDIDTAKMYVESKQYLWNSGNFIFNREFLIEKLKLTASDIIKDVDITINSSKRVNNEIILDKDMFEKVRSISIDYAVMEHVTDGKVFFENNHIKKFYNIKDGKGLAILRQNNIKYCLLSNFSNNKTLIVNDNDISELLKHLKFSKTFIGQGNKLEILDKWLKEFNVDYDEVAYIGDDINDKQVMMKVKFSGCPNDAIDEVKNIADYKCKNNGGYCCVREFCEKVIEFNTKDNHDSKIISEIKKILIIK